MASGWISLYWARFALIGEGRSGATTSGSVETRAAFQGAEDAACPTLYRARAHSTEYFSEEQGHWWNSDFLDLMACRFRLTEITPIGDVGRGIGHWSALIHPRLAPGAGLIGIDLDPANVAGALERTARLARDSIKLRSGRRLGPAVARRMR
jgi:hypothetical protein